MYHAIMIIVVKIRVKSVRARAHRTWVKRRARLGWSGILLSWKKKKQFKSCPQAFYKVKFIGSPRAYWTLYCFESGLAGSKFQQACNFLTQACHFWTNLLGRVGSNFDISANNSWCIIHYKIFNLILEISKVWKIL